jgi:hypothetical protein
MADDLSVAIERLRTSTERLNSICDTAAQTVRDVEAFLEDARVGVSARVSLGWGHDSPHTQESEWESSLEYRRIKTGKFRIACVQHYPALPPDEGMIVRPWSECTRDEKLESFEKLPELLVELSNLVNERASKAEKTVAAVSSLLPKKKKGG